MARPCTPRGHLSAGIFLGNSGGGFIFYAWESTAFMTVPVCRSERRILSKVPARDIAGQLGAKLHFWTLRKPSSPLSTHASCVVQ